MSIIKTNEKIGILASRDSGFASVFEQVGIRYLYTSGQTLAEASKEFGVASADLNKVLNKKETCMVKGPENFENWGLRDFAKYFTNNYYWVARRDIRLIYDMAQAVIYKHSWQHPELLNLTTGLFLFFDDYLFYLKKEELIFSQIGNNLDNNDCWNEPTNAELLSKLYSYNMKSNTGRIVSEYKFFREITNNYLCPEDGCSLYKTLYKKLMEFEKDLLFHICLKNDIFFPKIIKYGDVISDEILPDTSMPGDARKTIQAL